MKGVLEPVKRLAILWLTCAVVGFLAAVGAAYVLSLAVDGAGAWRGRPTDRALPPAATNAPANTASSAPRAVVATVLNRGGK